ncbi:MAG TPA: amidophosphoribosyltransferase [Rhodospirillaceae bacterium]|jgi:amidophosphoribosyltransferase|nr:amidophosphoribosyltransferase [Alphaproteobacteria bacterium]HBH26217.1 amidophosphoribosyltransferase [Rhodospirillaceae bacterium]
MGDGFHDECGVFGIQGHPDAAALAALGLHALQHRGQEACGIITHDGAHFWAEKALGLVSEAFGDAQTIDRLKGDMAIGHNRYATTGDGARRNVQPLYADLASGGFALAHNGNLTNAMALRASLVTNGAIFQSTSDTEVIVHLVALSRARGGPAERLADALRKVQGAYSLVAMAGGEVIGARDPLGIRPLTLGRLGDAHVLASESCALDIIGAECVREVAPGEMVVLGPGGLKSLFPFERTDRPRFCVFEYVYFARPDSFMEGRSVYAARKAIGAVLAAEAPVPGADIVVPVPDSGTPAAIGYAQAAGLPFELGIIRNHYVGRTFIEPGAGVRHLGVKLKHNANKRFLKDKSVVLVDDSIVRGTTSKKIVEMVRAAGAREVHMRIASPPTAHSCFYGIDTPASADLLAHTMDTEGIRAMIGADSLAYISLDGLYKAAGQAAGRDPRAPAFCDACFSGDYPVPLTDHAAGRTGAEVTGLLPGRRGKKGA